MTALSFELDQVDWAKGGGLTPAIVQDAETLQVLMLGYMDRAALEATVKSGLVTFYSRSKQRLWQKGESSGHVLRLVGVRLDCDQDTLLIAAKPEGPTCHLGTSSCFCEDTPRR
jgi:phosphoribosyl-ATP pyrophosphohydrolase/phosphoribosyl-AMP cyclohydrolase